MRKIAALFVRADSVYKTMASVDAWDIERDARKWPGGCPVVAHPPCRAWGRLRHMAKPRPDEKDLAFFAVDQVRKFGGVLEHPEASTLWAAAALPRPGESADVFGGFSISVDQVDWGHKARKRTWLYIVGIDRADLPPYNRGLLPPTHEIGRGGKRGKLPNLHKAAREHSPPAFAAWLASVARSVRA